ncbi:uncharacterized protein MYCFIDRAFT_212012 [Pseudocercospora fijiensis CIRAD86]|uniref:Uncharacterized protein n=1 Tax=Pseudocercospora fijiensis (strain CIRAD86) TaxID=383855 RepID=M3AT19_PSEFD|nr:uncharacterized protein MYCFIDRAFT_212012 [Pseudocercospora fijiensis CIRAD86]EME80258.1 hypothetical protein MYCFIDRAFT_212012 [Pseudocercospora fijiensis CIRAD86]
MRAILTVATTLLALVSTVSATNRCNCAGVEACRKDGAWGCVDLSGNTCVVQTSDCNSACGGSGFTYKRFKSKNAECICSPQDVSATRPCDTNTAEVAGPGDDKYCCTR